MCKFVLPREVICWSNRKRRSKGLAGGDGRKDRLDDRQVIRDVAMFVMLAGEAE